MKESYAQFREELDIYISESTEPIVEVLEAHLHKYDEGEYSIDYKCQDAGLGIGGVYLLQYDSSKDRITCPESSEAMWESSYYQDQAYAAFCKLRYDQKDYITKDIDTSLDQEFDLIF